jgi:hypothetical protein
MKRKQKTIRPLNVFVVDGEGDNAFWTKISAAFEHKIARAQRSAHRDVSKRPPHPRAEAARNARGRRKGRSDLTKRPLPGAIDLSHQGSAKLFRAVRSLCANSASSIAARTALAKD